jgi:E3 ubiquitin-protein ligase listerin
VAGSNNYIDAQLPEELLSLLLDAPSLDDIADDALFEFAPSIRGYLLSWLLVYRSYSHASEKVRGDYSTVLKSENYINPLLKFIFEVLGFSINNPIDLKDFEPSKIRSFNILESEDGDTKEKGMEWLLIHIYWLSLKYTPSLVRAWVSDHASKGTRLYLNGWTTRFFSPLVISDVMDDVQQWAENQETEEDENDLIVKTLKKSREVQVGYEIDDATLQIVVRIPAGYPLENAQFEGVNRVAVTELKWKAWLMNAQGALTLAVSTFSLSPNHAHFHLERIHPRKLDHFPTQRHRHAEE